MLLLEALFALLRRSLGTIVRAIFGWATLALFGEVRASERTLLSAIVGAAAAWPFMVAGIFLPKQAALVLAFLPIPKQTPDSLVRIVWIVATALIPLAVGWTLSRKAKSTQGKVRRLLLGFPATLGLGLAFLFACFVVPVRKVAAFLRGRKEEHVPLAVPPKEYHETAGRLREALERGGMEVSPAPAPWGTRVLGQILHVFGSAVFGTYLPANLEYLTSPDLSLTIYPNGVRILGREGPAARAHSVIAETATTTEALQCMSPEGQELEKRIKTLWEFRTERARFDREATDVAAELAKTPLEFHDWEILYRELLQSVVASRGASRLIQAAIRESAPETRPRRRSVLRRVRRAGRQAGSYGREKLTKAAAERGEKLVESLAGTLLRFLSLRRR
jgi:hypothetical protein